MDPARLDELTASIRESGIMQPILVRRRGERYQIVAGERRWRAAQAAGLATVPVTLRDIPDEQLLELALVENIQRQELTALEEAQAFQRLQEEFHLTQEEIARRVGRERSTIANTLRLLRLPRELRDSSSEGGSTRGTRGRCWRSSAARTSSSSGARRRARGSRCARSSGASRCCVRRAPKPPAGARKDANTRAAEERLRAALGTRVEIARRGQGRSDPRRSTASEAELNRLFELLLRGGRGPSGVTTSDAGVLGSTAC